MGDRKRRGDARLSPAVLKRDAQEVEHRAQQASGTPQKLMGQALDFLRDQQGSESFTSPRGQGNLRRSELSIQGKLDRSLHIPSFPKLLWREERGATRTDTEKIRVQTPALH